jgi:hypothetical protein
MSVYRPEERRLVLRLMAYWDDLRDERDFPTFDEIDPRVIGDDWTHCATLAVREPSSESQFMHLGEIYRPGLPDAGVTRLADCPHGTLLQASTNYIDRVLQKKVPVSLGGHAHLGGDSVLYRSILLPLSRDGETIDHVLGGANFRIVATGQDPNSVSIE